MLMTYFEGGWPVCMRDREDEGNGHRGDTASRLGGEAGVPMGEPDGGTVNTEKARALQEIARRMDTLMLGWMRKARLKEGEQ
jgi:hypothetical protein